MDRLLTEIDGYCERVDARYWSEPVNALTNLAFILVAVWMWRRSADVPMARALSAVLSVIGVGSWLFHTHAQVWAAILDVVPIASFILLYIFAINRDVLGLRPIWAGVATLGFFPYAALTVPLWRDVPVYGVSAGYMPVPMLILIYAAFLWRSLPGLSRGFVIGAAIVLVSLLFRGLDERVCAAFPLGTHFMWHVLNAVMLGWMIEVYRRYMAT